MIHKTWIVAGLLVAAAPARAAGEVDTDATTTPSRPAREMVGTGLFLPGIDPAARSTTSTGSAVAVAGFDGARGTALFAAAADVALARWLVLRAGVNYMPNDSDDRAATRPSVSLRGSLLSQDSTGVDLSVTAGYSQDRFAAEGGLLHLGVATGRSFDRLSLIGNAGFAGDPEGDDREGVLGGAALYRTTPELHLGAQGFFRRDLGSSDARHALRKDAQYDFSVGPVASYARDVLVFTLQAGVVGVKGETSATGLLALGGMGAAF